MNLAIRIAAAILSVPPDVLAPMVPPMAPPPRNALEFELRNEIDSALSGSCSSAVDAPLFAISQEEVNYVNCKSGMPADMEKSLFKSESAGDEALGRDPSTYGEVTALGARQLFYHMRLTDKDATGAEQYNPAYQFFDLGSGGGRLVIQSHLELPSLRKSVGIELSPSRHAVAETTWNELVRSGDASRVRKLAERSWGITSPSDDVSSTVELYEGDLFELDISQATHLYLSSLCFTESMLIKVADKIEREGTSLQIVASLKPLHGQQTENSRIKRRVKLGDPFQEFIEMSWTKARGDGCPVYFYTVEHAL